MSDKPNSNNNNEKNSHFNQRNNIKPKKPKPKEFLKVTSGSATLPPLGKALGVLIVVFLIAIISGIAAYISKKYKIILKKKIEFDLISKLFFSSL